MMKLELQISNEEARALRRELLGLRERMLSKMAGELPDKRDSATPAFLVFDRMLVQVQTHLDGLRQETGDDPTTRKRA